MSTVLSVDIEQEESLKIIEELDLSMIKFKLCIPVKQEGKGWTPEHADNCEKWYKRFLKLHVLCPNATIVPSRTIDEMWHAHILDTRKYHKDCESIFGCYLHHFPYFGLRGEEDAENLHKALASTKILFEEFFGESLDGLSSLCDGGCAGGGGDGGGECS